METSKFTIREAYVEASSFLNERGVRDASQCVEMLLGYQLCLNRSALFLNWEEPFPQEQWEQWQALLERKAQGEPVQYILGEQEFFGLPFRVNAHVLIPRPETELLVEQSIVLGGQLLHKAERSPITVDIGTGSGAIAVTLAVHCPEWKVIATDVSPAALSVAMSNAEHNDVAERITFLQGNLLEPIIAKGLAVDILLSNPPYIPTADLSGLQPEVIGYEPHLALDGGTDGLQFYREIIEQMRQLPEWPQLVGFEVGYGQAQDVRELLHVCHNWDEVRIVRDLAGIERHVIAIRQKT